MEEYNYLMRDAVKKSILQCSIVSATTAIALTSATNAWSANLNFVGSRDALGANDFVDWSNPITRLTDASPTSSIPTTFSTISAGGITVTGSQNGAFGEIRRQSSTPYTVGVNSPSDANALANSTFWNGNFAPNDAVYWNNGSGGGLRLSFSTPVSAVGTQLDSLFYHGSAADDPTSEFYNNPISPFRGTITAFYGNNGDSLTRDFNGTTNALANNSATFFGFTSDSADITSVVFTTTDLVNNGGENFALNRVSLRTTSGVQAVPEPFSILGTLFGGAAALKMRRRLKATNKL
jgi:hypothetical protein